jgi:hypothetical protein
MHFYRQSRRKTPSPLLSLPAELRNAIYTYVFGSGTLLIGRSKFLVPIDLLLVNRQIDAEVALLRFRLTNFIFDRPYVDGFLARLTDRQSLLIQRITLSIWIYFPRRGQGEITFRSSHRAEQPDCLGSLRGLKEVEIIVHGESIVHGYGGLTHEHLRLIYAWLKGAKDGWAQRDAEVQIAIRPVTEDDRWMWMSTARPAQRRVQKHVVTGHTIGRARKMKTRSRK